MKKNEHRALSATQLVVMRRILKTPYHERFLHAATRQMLVNEKYVSVVDGLCYMTAKGLDALKYKKRIHG